MYEDKILVCKECGNEFTFTAGEQEFYAERGFQNEPSAARPAATPARTPPAVPGSTSPLFALPAAARPECPSSPSLTVRSTAASALPRCATSRDKEPSRIFHNAVPKRRPQLWASLFSPFSLENAGVLPDFLLNFRKSWSIILPSNF